MTDTTIHVYTPVLVLNKFQECDDIPGMIKAWKSEYNDGPIRDMYEKGKTAKKRHPLITAPRLVLKYFWPSIVLSVAAYFGIWSSFFLAIAMIPIQIAILAYLLLEVYMAACVGSVLILEEKNEHLSKNG